MENHDFNNAQFVVDDLLNFPNDQVMGSEGMLNVGEGVSSGDSSTDVNTVVDSCNSSFSRGDVAGRGITDAHFSSDLCVPYDDMAELEWLSNFEEESFSTEDLQNLQIISGIKPRNHEQASQIQAEESRNNTPIFTHEVSVPGKARSKRLRVAPENWTSRLRALNPDPTELPISSPSPESNFCPVTEKKTVAAKKKDSGENSSGGDGRRCLHCATDKTPQWRTGPLGPKTLCNACGVRYKSGRLVPEYRPAASPTFVLTKHSNSHRKVMELRRQKEVQRAHIHHHQQFINHHGMMFDVSNGDDYLIHQHIGPDFRQLI